MNAHDVANYILDKHGNMTAMKLQKLLYYSQAWSLVWDERALFPETIEAWANGPVIPEIYNAHRGQFILNNWPRGNAKKLDSTAIETVDAVLKYYGDKSAQWLSDLSHKEKPWMKARNGMSQSERGNVEITPADMMDYYSGLQPADG